MEHIERVVGTSLKADGAGQRQSQVRVSRAVIARLPRYHRYLRVLLESGRGRISSAELSAMMHVTASQIRQDMNCFGGFGQQGYGYNVKYLYNKIGELLGVAENYQTVIIGAGNLGRALAGTHMFERRGITRLCLFDCDAAVVGQRIFGLPVYHIDTLEEFCRANRVDFAVLTTPREVAPDIALRLSALGVSGILNFANTELPELPHTLVENVHLSDPLMRLCYALRQSDLAAEDE